MHIAQQNDLQKAKELLETGDVVAMPTETVYGLAASIESETGLKKIFQLKQRPFFDPLIVHVASLKQAQKLTSEWLPVADFLARTFWPGPLTLVLSKSDLVHPLITSGLETVAIRFPNHPLAIELIELVGAPLAAPSANKFGKTSPSRADHVRSEFAPEIAADHLLVLDGGPCQIGLESTVISFETAPHSARTEGQSQQLSTETADLETTNICILRPGGITKEQIEEALKKWSGKTRVLEMQSHKSPGHLEHHYQPDVPLILINETPNFDETLKPANKLTTAELTKIEALLKYKPHSWAEIQLGTDPILAARNLYAEMRKQAAHKPEILWIRKKTTQSQGLWAAVWDRVHRASSFKIDA